MPTFFHKITLLINRHTQLITFFGYLAVLSLSYLPALRIYYVHHDELFFFIQDPKTFSLSPFTGQLVAIGRFTGALLTTLLSWMVYSVSDINCARFISILLLALSSVAVMSRLKRCGTVTLEFYLLPLIFFTLPPFQTYVAYAGNTTFSIAFFLALWAFLTATEIPLEENVPQKLRNKKTVQASLFLFLSLSIYQPAAMFYWVPVAATVLFLNEKNLPQRRQHLIHSLILGLGTIAIYFIVLQLMRFIPMAETGKFYDPQTITLDPFQKIFWFFKEPLFNSLNLWSIFPTVKDATLTALFILSGIITLGYQSYRLTGNLSQVIRRLSLGVLVMFALLLLSFLPNLVAKNDAAWYRCCAALTSIVLLMLLWAFEQWFSLLPARLKQCLRTLTFFVLALIGILSAHDNVLYYRALPSHLEISYIIENIRQADLTGKDYTDVHIIMPDRTRFKSRYDEFGILSTTYKWDVVAIIRCAFRELGKAGDLVAKDMTASASQEGEPFYPSPKTLVIDMPYLIETSSYFKKFHSAASVDPRP